MVRRHTYENMHKHPTLQSKSSPCLLLQQPPRSRRGTQGAGRGRGAEQSTGSPRLSLGTGIQQSDMSPRVVGVAAQISTSRKKGYENVILPELLSPTSPVPQYEEIEGPQQQPAVPGSTRGRMASITSSNLSEPFSPSPPLPDRKYLDTDIIQSPTPELAEESSSSGGVASRKDSTNSLHRAPMHQISDMGNEYAIVHRKQDEVGVVEVGVIAEEIPPPSLPLRAHLRMSSRENLLAESAGEGGGANVGPTVSEPVQYADLGMDSHHTLSPKEGYQTVAYSIVKLDPQTRKMEIKEGGNLYPLSPQPYEVASPTPVSTPHHELNTDPHYEEIESKDEMSG